MRIVLLTQYYCPEVGAVATRLSDLARRLKARGHEVTILTAMPNNPTGKIFPGYGGLVKREMWDGIPVIHTFIYPTVKTSLLHRLTNYFSFVISSALLGGLFFKRPDYLFVQSPPFFAGLSGVWLSRLKRTRLIVNISDLWPDSAVDLGMLERGSRNYKVSAKIEAFYYRKAWLVTGQSNGILANIKARFPDCPTFPLLNGVAVERFGRHLATPEFRTDLCQNADENTCIALYAGLHGVAQGLDQVLEAAKLLGADSGVHFVLIGDGAAKQSLVEQAERDSLSHVELRDPRPPQDIPPLLASADILLVTLKSHIEGAVPSKLYEAMASGRPIIVVADGEAAEITRSCEAGLVVKPGDIEGLVQALRELCQDAALREKLGANGRRAAEQRFNRERSVSRFIEHLEENLHS